MEGGATSLLNAEALTLVTGFAANIIPTVTSLIAIIVPVGLSCWAIGLAVKKGISAIQRKASKAI